MPISIPPGYTASHEEADRWNRLADMGYAYMQSQTTTPARMSVMHLYAVLPLDRLEITPQELAFALWLDKRFELAGDEKHPLVWVHLKPPPGTDLEIAEDDDIPQAACPSVK